MTKARLIYAAYDVRRAVTRQRNLSANPERRIGRSERLKNAKDPALRPSVRGNVFGSQPDPIPVTR
jgi:hypothetical protein